MLQKSLAASAATFAPTLIAVIGFTSPCNQLQAQNTRPRIPINSAVRDGGTLDWHSGHWKRAGGTFVNAPGATRIYDNTCTWAGGGFFSTADACEQIYDEGRIPTTDPADPINAVTTLTADRYLFCGFRFAYCTGETSLDMNFGFYQGLLSQGIGGSCGGPYTPTAAAAGLQLVLVGLPASPNFISPTCWDVTVDLSNNANGGFVFDGNDDVAYTGVPNEDLFGWSWSPANLIQNTANGTGLFIRGEPSTVVAGGENTFDIPPAADPISGAPCGSGLDTTDNFWVNTNQGQAVCTTPTGCYFFGGYPGNPFASWQLSMLAVPIDDVGFSNYCIAKASESGCLASMAGSPGQPVSGASDWSISASGVEAGRPGIFFTGNTGITQIPFQNGILCMFPPLKRGPIMFSFGTSGTCNGGFSQVINDGVIIPAGFDGGPGSTTLVQAWYRTPNLVPPTALSDAIEITWAP